MAKPKALDLTKKPNPAKLAITKYSIPDRPKNERTNEKATLTTFSQKATCEALLMPTVTGSIGIPPFLYSSTFLIANPQSVKVSDYKFFFKKTDK